MINGEERLRVSTDPEVIVQLVRDIEAMDDKGYLKGEGRYNFLKRCLEFTNTCPFCGNKVLLEKSSKIYRDEKLTGETYICSAFPECNSSVGTHPGSVVPLGCMANGVLKRQRMRVHHMIEAVMSQGVKKNEIYKILSKEMNASRGTTHVGMFDSSMCGRACEILEPMIIKTDDFQNIVEFSIGDRWNTDF